MTFSVLVESEQGQVVASLIGAPEVRSLAATRPEPLDALQTELARRVQRGELVTLEVPAQQGLPALAGKYADAPTLWTICEDESVETTNWQTLLTIVALRRSIYGSL